MQREPLCLLIVIFAAIATYANSVLNGFALDDVPIIAENARVHQLADQAAIWLTPYWPEHGSRAGLYRPLAIFGYSLQWAVGDGAPWPFHAANILLHSLVSVLVLLLLRRLVNATAAVMGALVFAVHPVHTEAVANVIGQAELVAAAPALGACLLWVSRPASRIEWWRFLSIVMLYALAMLAKESAIVLPGLLILLDFGTRQTVSGRALLVGARAAAPMMIALVAVAAAWFALRVHVLGTLTGADPAPYLPFLQDSPGQRFLTAVSVWTEYLRLLVWPLDLSADYSPAVIVPPAAVTFQVVAGGILLLATMALAAAVPWTRAGVAAAWFLIAVLPVSNLIIPIGVILAERTLYLPSFAIALGAAQLFADTRVKLSAETQRLAWAAASVVLLLAAGRSVARNPEWKDTSSYWSALIRDHPESYRAQRGAGEAMYARGDLAQAKKYLELAVQTWPYDADLQSGLGALYLRMGDAARALRHMEQARELGDTSAATQRNLAVAYLAGKRYADAWKLSESLGREHGGAALRAQALDGQGRYSEASLEWQQALSHDAPDWLAWMHLARARARAGDVKGALAAADTGRGFAPDAAAAAAADSVRRLIDSGCYTARPEPGPGNEENPCADPVEHRGIVVKTGNAKGLATAAAAAALRNGNDRQ